MPEKKSTAPDGDSIEAASKRALEAERRKPVPEQAEAETPEVNADEVGVDPAAAKEAARQRLAAAQKELRAAQIEAAQHWPVETRAPGIAVMALRRGHDGIKIRDQGEVFTYTGSMGRDEDGNPVLPRWMAKYTGPKVVVPEPIEVGDATAPKVLGDIKQQP